MEQNEWLRFAESVRELRRIQTRYFASRRSADLIAARRLEESIDAQLNRILNPRLPLDHNEGGGKR